MQMASNNEIIKSKIEELKKTGDAVIFDIGGLFVQLAPAGVGELYCEALSHNFNPAVSPALEGSFAAMGFKLDNGANYSKTYPVKTVQEIDKLVQDIERIFRELFRADENAQMEVIDVE
jgi:hypothetical protein